MSIIQYLKRQRPPACQPEYPQLTDSANSLGVFVAELRLRQVIWLAKGVCDDR